MSQLQDPDAAAYRDLSDEMQAYMSYICNDVLTSNTGILMQDQIDTSDETYIAWRDRRDDQPQRLSELCNFPELDRYIQAW